MRKMKTVFLLLLCFCLIGCFKGDDTIDITDLSSVELRTGEKVSYRFQQHPSVGFDAEYIISDKEKLQWIETKKIFDQPEHMNTSGGDGGVGLFVFQAHSSGDLTLKIKHLYRGDVESEKVIQIKILNTVSSPTIAS